MQRMNAQREKIEIKAQACSMSSLGEGQRPMQMGGQ